MKIGKLALLATLAGGLLAAAPASATQTITFAQFAQKLSTAKIFTYTNTGTATLNSSGATVLIANLGLLVTPAVAKFTMSSTAAGMPVSNAPFITQAFDGTMKFTLATPQFGMTNALTVAFTNAVLVAKVGGASPVFTADTSAGSTITYTSDFADLSGFLNKNFALSFSAASKPAALSGGRLPDFKVSGTGTFAATSVPEPATWALMLGGFGLAGLGLRSRASKHQLSYTG